MAGSDLRIHYHRDFDGMVSAAVLAVALKETRGESPVWSDVNYDQRSDWENFSRDQRFAIVDFHFHPRAEYWFDHHPTTFLTPELRAQYQPSDRWSWDESSPSCPPLILRHAREHWGFEAPARFVEMAQWSDIVDAARYTSVEQAVFGDEPALRIARALTVAPNSEWLNDLVGRMTTATLDELARAPEVDKAFTRASKNRDKALLQFPPTVENKRDGVLFYDASSNNIRRERFAPFYHHPDIHYAVGVIPTRQGFHVSCGQNPWNPPPVDVHIGEIMERYGGGGHKAVGGANPPDLQAARRTAAEIAEKLREALSAHHGPSA
jgi:oligoribonuclease NrnB/cAMP/cGMP phosphodiesterase (DHH superfamily)